MLYNFNTHVNSTTQCCCRETYFTLTLAIFTTHYLRTYGIRVTSALLQSCEKEKFLAGYRKSYDVPVLESSNKFKSANMSCM